LYFLQTEFKGTAIDLFYGGTDHTVNYDDENSFIVLFSLFDFFVHHVCCVYCRHDIIVSVTLSHYIVLLSFCILFYVPYVPLVFVFTYGLFFSH